MPVPSLGTLAGIIDTQLKGTIMDSKVMKDRLIDTDEAAKILGIRKSTLYSWIHQRRINFFKIGSLVKFSEKELWDFIESSKREPNQ